MFVQTVTLINRTKEHLICTFDGHEYDIKPGKNPGFPFAGVPYAKAQNPVLGTEDPYNPKRFVCKVGVEGTKDDVTPLVPNKQGTEAVERFDRSKMRGIAKKAVIEEGDPVTAMEARVAGNETEIDEAAVGRSS